MGNSKSKQFSGTREARAVLISDIHFNIQTVSVASAALNKAIRKANALDIPLIVAGDLHDTKANLRGECVDAMIKCFENCKEPSFVLVGNHDKINEKSEANALAFLKPYVTLVSYPAYCRDLGLVNDKPIWLIPYQHDVEALKAKLATIDKESLLIMHQGIIGSEAGHYYQDPTALERQDVADFRVVSGHYHRRQDIKCGRPRKGAVGLASYIGNPYTLGFGEANDPEKGFQILYSDGLLEFVPTELRTHRIIEIRQGASDQFEFRPGDLLWLKVRGSTEWLNTFDVKEWKRLADNVRLDLIPDEVTIDKSEVKKDMTQQETMDALIDSTNVDDERKLKLKNLWKGLI